MVNFFNKKFQKSIIYIGTLCALFLSCHGPVMNLVHVEEMREMNMSTHQAMNHSTNKDCSDKIAGCIDISYIIESSKDFSFLLTVAVVLSGILILIDGKLSVQFKFYIRAIRDRYGGFSLFNYLMALFSRGILQPKVFA